MILSLTKIRDNLRMMYIVALPQLVTLYTGVYGPV